MTARHSSGALGKYEVVEPLHPGAGFGPDAALVLHPDDPAQLYVAKRYAERGLPRARVLRELRQSKELSHQAVAPVIEWYELDRDLVAVFGYTDGVRLERIIDHLTAQNERLSDDAIWFIGREICGALATAHEHKSPGGKPMIHGHLGPDRIRISWQGRVTVYGLGLHALFGDEGRSPSALMYRAPEQRSGGEPTFRSDTYSAALILWTMLTGRPPAPNNPPPQGFGQFRDDVPEPLCRAIDTALEPLSLRRAVTCRGLEQLIRATYPVNDRELQFNMDVYRSLDVFRGREAPPDEAPQPPPLPQTAPAVREEVHPQEDDSTVQRLNDLFDAIEVGSSEVPQRDSTDDGWLVDAVRVTAPVFTEADLTPSPRPSAQRATPPPLPVEDRAPEPEAEEQPRVATPPPLPVVVTPPPLPVAPEAEPEPEAEAAPEAEAEGEAAPEAEAGPEVEAGAEPMADPELPVVRPVPSPPVVTPAPLPAPSAERSWGVTLGGAVVAAGLALVAAWLLDRGGIDDPVAAAPPATTTTAAARPAPPPAPVPLPTPTGDDMAGADAAAPDATAPDVAAPDAAAPDAATASEPAEIDEADLPVVVDEFGDAPTLAAEGYLIVRSPVKAEVLVNGVVRGFTNHKLKSSCYTRNVRLRDPDTMQWLTEGQPVRITCMATTTVVIPPAPPEP